MTRMDGPSIAENLPTAEGIRQLAADVFGPHEIPRWPFIPLAAPLVLLAYLKLRRVL